MGAFAALGGTRRRALWQVEALGRSGRLFAGIDADPGAGAHNDNADDLPAGAVLPEMSRGDEMLADFRGTGLTTGPHPMTFVRERLSAEGVLTAAALARVPNGHHIRVAGMVVVRQRPGTAKGFVFLTVEDESGFANAIVTPRLFEQHRRTILRLGAMIIEGTVQNQEGVVSIKADAFLPVPGGRAAGADALGRGADALGRIDISHDFH